MTRCGACGVEIARVTRTRRPYWSAPSKARNGHRCPNAPQHTPTQEV